VGDLRQQLSNAMELEIADKADVLMTRLLPQYSAVPKLDGKGQY
jgi:hypothetical protein